MGRCSAKHNTGQKDCPLKGELPLKMSFVGAVSPQPVSGATGCMGPLDPKPKSFHETVLARRPKADLSVPDVSLYEPGHGSQIPDRDLI